MINVTPSSAPHTATDLLNLTPEQTALEVKDLNLYYGNKQALFNVKAFLLLDAIGKAEGLVVDEAEVDKELQNLADAKSAYGAIVYNKAPAVLRGLLREAGLAIPPEEAPKRPSPPPGAPPQPEALAAGINELRERYGDFPIEDRRTP